MEKHRAKKHHAGFVIWKKKNRRGQVRWHVALCAKNGIQVWAAQPGGYARLRSVKNAIRFAGASGLMRVTNITPT